MTNSYIRDLIDTFPMGLSNSGQMMTEKELTETHDLAKDAQETIAISIQTVGELIEHMGMGEDRCGLSPDLCLNVGSLVRVLGELAQGAGDAGENLAYAIQQRGVKQ